MYYGIGRPSHADVLAIFYEGVGFTEAEYQARKLAEKRKEQEEAAKNPELALITAKKAAELAKFNRFKTVEARFGKAIAFIDANGWDFEKMTPGAIEATRLQGKDVVGLSFKGCRLPPKFGFLIAEFFPNLQKLDVSHTNFNNDDVAFVRDYLRLNYIDLTATDVTTHFPQLYQS